MFRRPASRVSPSLLPLDIPPHLMEDVDVKDIHRSLKELRDELILLKRRTARVESAIRALEALNAPDDSETKPATSKGALGTLSYPEAARAILNKANRPLRIAELLARMERGGRPIQTTGPYRTLYRVLRDHPAMFVNRSGLWSLKKGETVEWPLGELPDQAVPEDE
jgi:hypothetical protein